MIIQYNKDGHVDFKAPIHMTPKQLDEFSDFFKKELGESLEKIETLEKEKVFGGKELSGLKRWTIDEYALILSDKSNEKITEITGRSKMAVIMQRGNFVPTYFSWIKKKGYNTKVTKNILQEFLKENNFV